MQSTVVPCNYKYTCTIGIQTAGLREHAANDETCGSEGNKKGSLQHCHGCYNLYYEALVF